MSLTNKHMLRNNNVSSFGGHIFIYGVLLLLTILHFFMAINFEVNWDEFFRLGRIYEWKNGTLSAIFESNYVHAFRWLEHVSQNEVHQIIAARCIMFGLLIYISFMSFLVLRDLFDHTTAAITLISFLSFSYIFRHATSFRIDLPIISLLITVIWLIIPSDRKFRHFLIAGLCLGLAGSISIKSIFYVPTISSILLIHWWQSGWKKKPFFKGCLLSFTSVIFFLILTYLHSLTLTKADSAYGFIGYASNAAILAYGIFPQKGVLTDSISQNPIYWTLMLSGCGFAIYDIVKGHKRVRAFICISSLLPLISLVIYVHTYIYFYTYILAAASLMVGYGISRITNRINLTRIALPIVIIVGAAPVLIGSFYQTKNYQIQVNNVIHTMFPRPVNYIDRTSQISSFPKQGLFMTVVQMDEYKTREVPVMASIFEKNPPEFVLANIESLKLDQVKKHQPSRRLMMEDEDLLVENFIHHWGPIYVPGKHIEGSSSRQNIKIKLPGTYTIESQSNVIIDGITHSPNTSLHLKKGTYFISTQDNEFVRLRWGTNLYKPDFNPLDTKIFHGF